jgi:glycosyltransferase involved in cell wall biosynthesis
VELLLLADGSQAGRIRQILERGGVMDRVTFAGQIPQQNLPRFYHIADIFISPSHVDGTSVSLLEALACGLPCLVSDIPANKEWISDGENGWLFPDGDAGLLAAKIIQVLEQRQVLKKVGDAARMVAEQRADWKKNFGQLMHAYEMPTQTGRK